LINLLDKKRIGDGFKRRRRGKSAFKVDAHMTNYTIPMYSAFIFSNKFIVDEITWVEK
jgi:hypothetical protein